MSLRRSELARKTPLRRSGGLRQVSKKRAAEQRVRRQVMLAAFGPNPVCAIRWDDNCTGAADAPHEIKKRSRGGSITDPANCVPACSYCNCIIEDFPEEANKRGWAVHSWGK